MPCDMHIATRAERRQAWVCDAPGLQSWQHDNHERNHTAFYPF